MKIRNILASAVLIVSIFSLTGCGKKTESWAYAHEPGEEVLSLYDNGKAFYKGNEYKYTKDDTYITLKDSNETQSLRYVMQDDKMLLYEKSIYHLESGDLDDGIFGVWTQENGWSYQFSEEGRFSEDNIFFGKYTVDEKEHSIRLMYDDPIEDAYLYYAIDGDSMTIEYPWPMVAYVEGEK
ncbi:hypothetical protein [Butyrivibrio sp. YAB3001]|uniref:hypothetical protein n=1 Tax=Butyrivibrio sp. YAB3001 TaxID=1520812 RepID=UPI0011317906|nr:hypothetical protein [Butyrivibrio sp. YAB3001]